MEKIVYHGSPNGGIKEFKLDESTHRIKCLYAAENKVIAMLFMARDRGDLDTVIGMNDDGVPYIAERREGILKGLYNREGYLYTIDGSTFHHEDYLWSPEVISTEPSLKPIDCTYYPNILEALKKEADKGNLEIYEYPNRPKNVPLDNSDLIDKYISFDNNGNHGALDSLLSVYPEFREQVFSKLEMPTEFYYIDRKRNSFDEIIANDNLPDAFLREDSPIFVREDGWLNYNIIDSKFAFEKGGFNLDEDFYIYKLKGDAKRLSAHSFHLDRVQILSSERINLSKYLMISNENKEISPKKR